MEFWLSVLGWAGFSVAVILYCSVFEWVFHRYWLHDDMPPEWTGNAHRKHHTLLRAQNFFVKTQEQRESISFPLWGILALLASNSPTFALIGWLLTWQHVVVAVVLMLGYYVVYEYFHYCMHVPKNRFFESWKIYRWIRFHHYLHHENANTNLNVVLPFTDIVLRTFRLKSRFEKPFIEK